ncbi:CAT8 [Candida oxycetoniae]|uniref:CAT8 n=1 Tax=Candida oxycetoniae TaxID=497107 RepID=A0AAI9T1P4_9ASCO|nr:CAT8 [Candida oxycetoniae]KAI3406827.2 CAT8 [Candida oxycetoniae]
MAIQINSSGLESHGEATAVVGERGGGLGGGGVGGGGCAPSQSFNESPHAEKSFKSVSHDLRGNAKTIRAPGSRAERVAQACDRCRAKKTKCNGGNPCSTCSAVGLKCIVSDKLSRKAFPKGYTETLEERVRHLEAENKKLMGLLDMRGERLEMLNAKSRDPPHLNEEKLLPLETGGDRSRITASNLHLLEQENSMHLHMHNHENGCSCGCAHPNAVHDKPVSVAGSLYETGRVSIASSIRLSDDENDDNDSLISLDDARHVSSFARGRHFALNSTNRDSSPAPGAFAAATAIAQMQKNKSFQQHHQQQQQQQQQQKLEKETDKQRMLTSLVATSIPRSTEETLCIPTLLARICQAYGYDSRPSVLAANTLASLKEQPISRGSSSLQCQAVRDRLSTTIMNRDDIHALSDAEAITFLRELVKFPVSRLDLDQLLTLYFQTWGNTLPLLDKSSFLKCYMKVIDVLEFGTIPVENKCLFESIEKVGALLVLSLSLGFLASKNVYLNSDNAQFYVSLMKHYDFLIHEFVKPNCLLTKVCSIQSLQILSLALQYCLATGDLSTCYELRGRVISMAQQLRLHRCPAAVLGMTTNTEGNFNLQNFMQAERRILFWCIYCLDVYSSLNLGVPRLMKDYEIECAMPFAGKGGSGSGSGSGNSGDNNSSNNNQDGEEEDDNVNILVVNNTQLSIVGKVSRMALSVMFFCKVLASILDSIYSRFNDSNTLYKDKMLDTWRRELPPDLRFELDTNGLSLKTSEVNYFKGDVWETLNSQQLTLIYLYYHAKILIHLPIISKHGHHHNVGLSQKEQLSKGESDTATIVATMSVIQQSSSQILEVIKSYAKKSSSPVLPLPINVSREQALLALLVSKGTLDYIKGGHLFNSSKQLVLDSVAALLSETKFEVPGCLTRNSSKLLELTVLSILGINLNRFSNFAKKSPNPFAVSPILKSAVEREPKGPKVVTHMNGSVYSFSSSPSSGNPKIINNPGFVKDEDHKEKEAAAATAATAATTAAAGAINQPGPKVNVLDEIQSNSQVDSDQVLSSDDMESLENLLKFDPFSITSNNQLYLNEYVTDGSLGLAPFLDISSQDAAFSLGQNNYFENT